MKIIFSARQSIFLAAFVFLACSQLQAGQSFPSFSDLPENPATPEVLTLMDGSKVTTPKDWIEKRRPELKALFAHYMFGPIPPAPAHVRYEVERADYNYLNGKAVKKEIAIHISDATNAPVLHLLLIIPFNSNEIETRARTFPVFVGLNFCGNHTLLPDTNITITESWCSKYCPGSTNGHATAAGRGAESNTWNIGLQLERGYAVATMYYGDAEPDSTNAPGGLRAFMATKPAGVFKEQPADEYTAMGVWAWALLRAADYLETENRINKRRIAVIGHSRLGKAALLAAAFDERFALVAPLQAGCGGTAPSRGKTGESIKIANQRFPHWFNGEFKKFSDDPARLPFDQNCLIALVPPRPLIAGAATEDTWGNPAGVLEMLKAAGPAYELLGKSGVGNGPMPPENQPVGGDLAYFIRPGKHSMTATDWRVILDYADKMMR